MYQAAQKAFSSILSPTLQWATLGEQGAEVVPFLWYITLKEETEKNGIRLLYATSSYYALRRPMATALVTRTTNHNSRKTVEK